MKKRFLICNHCGNIVAMIRDRGVPVQCCGEAMREIIPGTGDGAQEKHVPVYDVKDGTVTVSVGSTEHPMTPEHYIEWICIETEKGLQYKNLTPNRPPRASFYISRDDKIKAVNAICNLHSLRKA